MTKFYKHYLQLPLQINYRQKECFGRIQLPFIEKYIFYIQFIVFRSIFRLKFKAPFRRWLYSHASYAVAFSDLSNLTMLITGIQGP